MANKSLNQPKFIKTKWLFCILSISAMLFGALGHWVYTPKVLPTDQYITLKPGQNVRQFAQQLEKLDLISSPRLFEYTVRIMGASGAFQAGTYRFQKEVSPLQIIQSVQSGDTYEPLRLKITFPEGSNLTEVSTILHRHKLVSSPGLWPELTNTRWAERLNIPGETLEGFIYPSTYLFHGSVPTAQQVIERAVQEFFNQIPNDYQKKVQGMGLSLHEAVTFASLIEKETAILEEMPKVSEVIWARLNKREPLGIDAALIYGIADYKGNIRWKHLRDRKNPYNTRIHKGLPPTPIASPSIQALGAVLTPTQFGYYFYVLKPGSRFHHFSKTAQEHRKHVRILVQASRKKKGNHHGQEKGKHKK